MAPSDRVRHDEAAARAERARAIGLFRYQLIREAADPGLSTKARGRRACHDSRVSHGSVSGLNLSQWKSSGEEDDERVERYFPAVGPSS